MIPTLESKITNSTQRTKEILTEGNSLTPLRIHARFLASIAYSLSKECHNPATAHAHKYPHTRSPGKKLPQQLKKASLHYMQRRGIIQLKIHIHSEQAATQSAVAGHLRKYWEAQPLRLQQDARYSGSLKLYTGPLPSFAPGTKQCVSVTVHFSIQHLPESRTQQS